MRPGPGDKPQRESFEPCTCLEPGASRTEHALYGWVCAGCYAYVNKREAWESFPDDLADYERDMAKDVGS